MNETTIEVRDLVARYGRARVLDGLSLDVPAGSVTALLGRNGAGKTTLMRALTGELRAERGRVSLLGVDPARRPRVARRLVGFVPDRTVLPAWMRVREHWRFLAPFYPTWDEREAERLARLFEVDPARRFRELSKGGQTLVALIGALAFRPRLLILDEPFSGLDVVARARVFEGVLEHLRALGGSALVASHSLVDVERCADRVAFLCAGRIVLQGDLEELCADVRRLVVEPADPAWSAPEGVRVERRDGRELVLLAPTGGAELEERLRRDPRLRRVETLERDLEDLVLATLGEERAA